MPGRDEFVSEFLSNFIEIRMHFEMVSYHCNLLGFDFRL